MVKEAAVWSSQTSTVSDIPTPTATSIGRTHIMAGRTDIIAGRTHIRTHTKGPRKPLVGILEYPRRGSKLTPFAPAKTTQVRGLALRESRTHGGNYRFLLSGVVAIAIIFIGCRFLLAPSTAAAAYGVPAGVEPHSLWKVRPPALLVPAASFLLGVDNGKLRDALWLALLQWATLNGEPRKAGGGWTRFDLFVLPPVALMRPVTFFCFRSVTGLASITLPSADDRLPPLQ